MHITIYDDIKKLNIEKRKSKALIGVMIGFMTLILILAVLILIASDAKIISILFVIPEIKILQIILEELHRIRIYNERIQQLKSKQLMKETMNEILNNYDSEDGGK